MYGFQNRIQYKMYRAYHHNGEEFWFQNLGFEELHDTMIRFKCVFDEARRDIKHTIGFQLRPNENSTGGKKSSFKSGRLVFFSLANVLSWYDRNCMRYLDAEQKKLYTDYMRQWSKLRLLGRFNEAKNLAQPNIFLSDEQLDKILDLYAEALNISDTSRLERRPTVLANLGEEDRHNLIVL